MVMGFIGIILSWMLRRSEHLGTGKGWEMATARIPKSLTLMSFKVLAPIKMSLLHAASNSDPHSVSIVL